MHTHLAGAFLSNRRDAASKAFSPLWATQPSGHTRIMGYLKPPWFNRAVFNRIVMVVGPGPVETLVVDKRVTKQQQQQKVPVTPVEIDGVKYLVSAYVQTQWAKNVRANPNVKLGGVDYVAAETAAGARKPILDAYKAKVGRAVEKPFRQLPDEADHPVFALTRMN